MREFFHNYDPVYFVSHIDGDCVNTLDGRMDDYLAAHPEKGIVSMIIHEEYYYPDYRSYIPDCGERVLRAIKHVYDKGFRGVALEKILLEKV